MRQPLSLLLWLMELGAGLRAAMLLALWLWSASEGSLAAALGWAGRYLGAGQSVQVQDARGALRDGGRVDAGERRRAHGVCGLHSKRMR